MSHNGNFHITDRITEMGVLKGICNEASTEQNDKTLLICVQGLKGKAAQFFSSPKICVCHDHLYATFSVSTKLHCLRVGPLYYIVQIDFVLQCKVPEELIRMQKMMIMTAAWVATCNGYRRGGIVEMKIDIFCYCCCWRIFLASQRVANELWVLC